MRRQDICFNCKEKRNITAKLRESRKKLVIEIEKSVDKMIKGKLRKFVKR